MNGHFSEATSSRENLSPGLVSALSAALGHRLLGHPQLSFGSFLYRDTLCPVIDSVCAVVAVHCDDTAEF